jgi:hypothetical protein
MNTSKIDALAMAAVARADFPHDDTVATSNEPRAAKTNTSSMASGEINLGDGKAQPEVAVVKKKSSRRIKSSFPDMLHAIPADKDLKSIITWLPSGKSFVIMDRAKFIDMVLARYFRETRFDSFSRRLKRWGFNKVYTTGMAQAVYCHRLFQKDRLDLRKLMNGGAERKVQAQGHVTTAVQQGDIGAVMAEEARQLIVHALGTPSVPGTQGVQQRSSNMRNQSALVSLPQGAAMASYYRPTESVNPRAQFDTALMTANYMPRAMAAPSIQMSQINPTMAMMNILPQAGVENTNIIPTRNLRYPPNQMVDMSAEMQAIDGEIAQCQEQLDLLRRLSALQQRRNYYLS